MYRPCQGNKTEPIRNVDPTTGIKIHNFAHYDRTAQLLAQTSQVSVSTSSPKPKKGRDNLAKAVETAMSEYTAPTTETTAADKQAGYGNVGDIDTDNQPEDPSGYGDADDADMEVDV